MKDAFDEFGIAVPPIGIMIEDPGKLAELYPEEKKVTAVVKVLNHIKELLGWQTH